MQDNNTSPLQEFIRNKIVWAFFAIDIIAVIILVGFFINQASKVSTINFNVVPLDATISVNGDTNYANGQHNIAPGQYQISISHDGLETKTMSISIQPHDYASVTMYLTDADKTFEFYKLKDNYESYKKLKTIAAASNNITTDNDKSAEEFIIYFDNVISIYDKLPIKGYVYTDSRVNMSTGGFTINGGRSKKECIKSACLLVTHYGKDYEDEVLKQIKKAGYNPDDYQIIYERRS
jgi:hypothetical protein